MWAHVDCNGEEISDRIFMVPVKKEKKIDEYDYWEMMSYSLIIKLSCIFFNLQF